MLNKWLNFGFICIQSIQRRWWSLPYKFHMYDNNRTRWIGRKILGFIFQNILPYHNKYILWYAILVLCDFLQILYIWTKFGWTSVRPNICTATQKLNLSIWFAIEISNATCMEARLVEKFSPNFGEFPTLIWNAFRCGISPKWNFNDSNSCYPNCHQ